MFFSSLLKVSINKVFSHQIKEKLKSQIFSLPKKIVVLKNIHH